MNPTLQRYLLSSTTTFLSTFFGTIALQLSAGGLQFTSAFLLSLLMVAGRAGIKALVESMAGQHADTPTA